MSQNLVLVVVKVLHKRRWLFLSLAALMLSVGIAFASGNFSQICPGAGVQQRTPDFQPGGIILTAFDRSAVWVYDIDNDRRYPLPDTLPCATNCRLSPDAHWVTYVDIDTGAYGKMRLNGTQRTPLVNYAADVEWWSPDTLLVWTPGHGAYLRAETGDLRDALDVHSVLSVQPGGRWGLVIQQQEDIFTRSLVNLETRNLRGIAEQSIGLGEDVPYFDTTGWSPDGQWLAYVAPGTFDPATQIAGGEIYAIQPGNTTPEQWTDFNSIYGAVRINGHNSASLSWSPDGTRLAFWVIELLNSDPVGGTGTAVIHILDTQTGDIHAYCDFATNDHTPDPPRLIWSPDGTHLAFGANVPGDDKSYLLLALDTETGVFTELSNGIFPVFGNPDPVVWGYAS